MHRGLWWTMLPTVQIVFSTPSGVSADLWRWCWQMLCKTTVAAAMGFYDVDIGGFLHLAHNPLVWMVERSWGGARAATGKWQNWGPAQSPAAAAQFKGGCAHKTAQFTLHSPSRTKLHNLVLHNSARGSAHKTGSADQLSSSHPPLDLPSANQPISPSKNTKKKKN